jgi:hypothetical protein
MRTFVKIIGLTLVVKFGFAADVQWSRLRGTVKSLDYKTQRITIQNHEGDLLSVLITPDVHIIGKEAAEVPLKDVHLDDKVILTLIPEADKPKDETFEQMNAGKPQL